MVKSIKNINKNKSKNKIELNKTKVRKRVYLDNASATPLYVSVLNKMHQVFIKHFANPSAIHDEAMKTKKVLDEARDSIGKILGAHMNEIIFTSGATESNNLAILGMIPIARQTYKVPHIVISNIEHASVLEVCKFLEKEKKIEVTYLEVEKNGILDVSKLKEALKENTVLVSVMYANNEIGTIQPIKEISKAIRHFKKHMKRDVEGDLYPLFHTDATQGVNYLDMNVLRLGVDMMSLNGGKIYGPKGVGVLFKKRNINISPIMFGGDQEFGLRAGTQNTPLILGLAEALLITEKIKDSEVKRLINLRDYFIKKLKILFAKLEIEFTLNGDELLRLPNIVNITIPRIPSDLLLIEFSARGIYVSEKSACKSGDKKNSHVLEAIHGTTKEPINSIRFSLGRDTKKQDLDYVLISLSDILKKLKKWYI